ncbi:cell wall-associated NlpC family hydrolase [Nonomuraea thailandensis]|uniref:Cell wall-associated NlpC family hydrolase n=1 Tax=Nonomuraea thailandensis TaxID=1188745 RepID=A0A9X2K922_9ACTN|nr:C40 family peptidase [Nonomuraea thailandensis]MCP2364315.1 cell wall-associated NlpC family hydrolase [Nonomuraea thailandensis]
MSGRTARLVAATVTTLSGLGLPHPAHAHPRAISQQLKAHTAVHVATAQVGSPYRYGATGPGAFDCSGLAQYAWRRAGVLLPRRTYDQYTRIRRKVSWAGLRPGDLVFFYGKGHVGIYIGRGRMVHAPRTGGRVRVDQLAAWWRRAFAGAVRPGA